MSGFDPQGNFATSVTGHVKSLKLRRRFLKQEFAAGNGCVRSRGGFENN